MKITLKRLIASCSGDPNQFDIDIVDLQTTTVGAIAAAIVQQAGLLEISADRVKFFMEEGSWITAPPLLTAAINFKAPSFTPILHRIFCIALEVCTYTHAYIHAYIHTHIHTYTHPSIHR